MTCLCKYLTAERAARAGVDISGKVCVFCARKPGVSFPPETTVSRRCSTENCDGIAGTFTGLCRSCYQRDWERRADWSRAEYMKSYRRVG